MPSITIPTLPRPLAWEREPQSWRLADGTLELTAGSRSDYFIDPEAGTATANAPALLFAPDPHFTLSARVGVDFAAMYDAGVLMLYAGPTSWAKLCFELSPQHQPTIVSVVTNTRSDDCNGPAATTPEVLLRITGLGQAFAFHYSTDGGQWQLVRYFALAETANLRVGFEAQSPTGHACTARFSEIAYRAEAVADIRSGV